MLNISDDLQKSEAISFATELKEKVVAGENFETLIKKYSDDEGTRLLEGNLGTSDGSLFPSQFEKVLSSLKIGEVSDPVVLNESVHLLKLTDIQNPQPEDFDSMKKLLEETLSKEETYDLFLNIVEKASDLMFSSVTLEELSKELEIEIKETNFFTRTESESIFRDSLLSEKIFRDPNIQKGQLSELIELNDQRAVIFKIVDFQNKEVKDFDSVAGQAKEQLKEKLIEKKLTSLQLKILQGLKEGKTLKNISSENRLNNNVVSYKQLGRNSSLFPSSVLTEIFNAPRSSQPVSFSSATLPGGNKIIFVLDKINESSETLSNEDTQELENFYLGVRSESDLADIQVGMLQEAKVVRY